MARTVLVVDDHPSFRASARRLLETEGYAVVGEAEDGATALAAVRELCPEVVLLDVRLPDVDGLEVAARLARAPDGPAVILTSSRDASTFRPRLEDTGAVGFILKNELSGETLAALLT